MKELLKIYHELIITYRLPEQLQYQENEAITNYIDSRENFLKKLNEVQKIEFNDLTNLAFQAVYFQLKKYYFLGYDTVIENKKSDD